MNRHLRTHLQVRMLRAIAAIDEQQSLLKASAALGVTQPALTRTLRDVEALLGDQIFERHSRGVRVTPFGRLVCDTSRHILAEIDRMDRELEMFRSGDTAVVSIGATAPAAVGVLPGYFSHLRARAPNLKIRVNQGTMEELLPLLQSGEITLLVCRLYEPDCDDNLDREQLYYEHISILARAQHPVFSEHRVTAETLSRYSFVLPRMSLRVEDEFQRMLRLLNFRLEVTASSQPFLRELLHNSDSLTLSPAQTMAGDIMRGTIRIVPFDLPGPPRPAGIMLKRNRPRNGEEQRVVDLLRECLLQTQSLTAAAASADLSRTPYEPSA